MADEDEGERKGTREDEEARLPGATILPAGFALGVALLLIGLVTNWVVFGIGVAIAVIFGFFWILDAFAVLPRRRPGVEEPSLLPERAEEEPERYGRDVFLERTTLGLGAVIGVIVTVPIVGFAIAPAFIGQDDEDIDLGPLENFPEGRFVVANFLSKPSEGAVSERTAFIRNNGFLNGLPSFTIISNRCAHLGCPTQPQGPTDVNSAKEVKSPNSPVSLTPTQPNGFGCPCHGGAYDLEGNRTAGPPVRALDRYAFKIIDGRLVLSDRFSVGKVIGTGAQAKIEAYTLRDPGEHVDGPTDWLYPVSPRGA